MGWCRMCRYVSFVWWTSIAPLPRKIRRRVWNKHLLLRWYRLWIREEETHPSLDIDHEAMLEMDDGERGRYLANLYKRRECAHQNGLAKH